VARSNRILSVLKLLVGLGIIGLLLRKVDTILFRSIIASAHKCFLVYGFLFYGLASVMEIIKFRSACLNCLSIKTSIRLVFLGLFFNNFFPSNVGGDAYKLVRMRSLNIPTNKGFIYVLSDRLTGLLALLMLGCGALFLLPERHDLLVNIGGNVSKNESPLWMAAAVGFLIFVPVLFLALRKLRNRIQDQIRSSLFLISDYVRNGAFRTLIFASLFQMSRALAILNVSHSLGYNISFLTVLVILALVGAISILPISIGGLGVREGTLSCLLHIAGLSLETAVAVAFINLVVVLIKSLVGGIIFLCEGQFANIGEEIKHDFQK